MNTKLVNLIIFKRLKDGMSFRVRHQEGLFETINEHVAGVYQKLLEYFPRYTLETASTNALESMVNEACKYYLFDMIKITRKGSLKKYNIDILAALDAPRDTPTDADAGSGVGLSLDPGHSITPEREYLAKEFVEKLEYSLTDEENKVFSVLKKYEGDLTFRELSDILGTSLSSAWRIISKIRGKALILRENK